MDVLTSLVKDNFSDVSEKARNYVSVSVTDFFAVALAALNESAYRSILEYVTEIGKGDIPLPGTIQRVSAQQAALALGTLGHALDYDDISAELNGHPSTVLLPTLLSLGYELNCTGKELMDAYLAGYEALAIISSSVSEAQYAKGWHTTSTIGIFGAVIGACRLLSLDSSKTAHALGIVASLASGIRANFGSQTKPLHAGWAAGNAVFAAKLAEKGFESSPEAINSAQSYFKVYAGLQPKVLNGQRRFIEDGIIIKPYPSCGYSIRAIDSALKIREQARLRPDDIQSIECYISPMTNKVLRFTMPKTGLQAKFSLEYCVAQAILNGSPHLQHFTDEFISNQSKTFELMGKISRKIITELAEVPYGLEFMRMEVSTKDGRMYTVRVDAPKGFPQNPLNELELEAKFLNCTENLWDEEKQKRLYKKLRAFYHVEHVSQLMDEFFL